MNKQRAISYASDGLTTDRVQEICHFTHPDLPDITVKRAKGKQEHYADIVVIGLEKAFHTAEDINDLYEHDFNSFLDSLQMFIMGTIKQEGIYINIRWSNEALIGAVNYIGKNK